MSLVRRPRWQNLCCTFVWTGTGSTGRVGSLNRSAGVADPLIRSAGVADPVNGRADPVQDGEREREVG